MNQVPLYLKVDLQLICTVLIDNVDRLSKRQSQALLKALLAPPSEDLPEETQVEKYCKYHKLSFRQGEILELLVQGLSSCEIAKQLNLTSRTVDSHLAAIYSKTGCCNRTRLVVAILTSKLH